MAWTHCCCSSVIRAEPSASLWRRVKLSTMAPTKRLADTKVPITIQSRKKMELADASLRSGATSTPTTSMP